MNIDHTFYYGSNQVLDFSVNAEPWFRGKDVATILDYADTKKAITQNVSDVDKQNLEEVMGESQPPIGLYCSIFGNKKQ